MGKAQGWDKFDFKNLFESPRIHKAGSFPGLRMNPDDIFRVLAEDAERAREMAHTPHDVKLSVRFYVDGVRIRDPLEYLPAAEDKNFAGWHQRLTGRQGLKDYAIVASNIAAVDRVNGMREFVAGLFSHFGIPTAEMEFSVFAGAYSKTAFGVHNDPTELNFYFPLLGKKKMRLWRPDFPEKNPGLVRAFEYDEFKSGSVLLEADPGSLMAWDGRWWHIAEGGDGAFSLSASIALRKPERQDRAELVSKIAHLLMEFAAGNQEAITIPVRFDGQAADSLPALFGKAASEIAAIDPEEVKEAMTASWLRKLATFSTDTWERQNAMSAPFYENAVVQCPAGDPIRWVEMGDGNVLLSTAGGPLQLPASNFVIDLIKTLNEFKPVPVSRLLAGKDEAAKGRILKLLEVLGHLGAVHPATSQNSAA